MPLDYLPTNDRELLAWLRNFNKVAMEHKATLGLTDEDLTELMGATNTLDTKITSNDAVQRAAVASTEEKNAARKVGASLAHQRAKAIQTRQA